MKISLRSRASLVLAITASSPAAAQTQLWGDQFGTPSADYVHSIAPDGAGGMILTGSTNGNLGGTGYMTDGWIARYDAAGQQLWLNQFNDFGLDSAGASVTDGLGGFYITGGTCDPQCSSGVAWFGRYSAAGVEYWRRYIISQSDIRSDAILAATSAPGSGLYVAGSTENSLGGQNAGRADAWLARYDPGGFEVWIRQFGTAEVDQVSDLCPDDAGGLYACGITNWDGSATRNGWLARYDGAGNEVWFINLATDAAISGESVCTDGSGGVYVSGYTNVPLGGQANIGGADAFVARYDDAGNEIWTRIFGTTSGDSGEAVAPNGSSGVYLAGTSTVNSNGFYHEDTWLLRLDAYGNVTWEENFGVLGNERIAGLATDGSGGVYVGGDTEGSLLGASAGQSDIWFARYDGVLAAPVCSPSIPNSTGESGVIDAIGSNATGSNDLTLLASQLPPGSFGFFLTSQTMGMAMPVGSQGILCLDGSIGRYQLSAFQGPSGELALDLGAMPTGPGTAVAPGDTWFFQCWYRDANPASTSNLTDAISVTFN